MLATFIASLGIRYRISRPKIRELLNDWVGVSLSVGTIDRCIREVGIACSPVVEELIEQLQSAEIIHLDETSWYEKGKYRWLWVAITATIAVYHIGSRRKEELLHLITEAFVGWLVTDWDAVVACFYHPQLPATNNEAERALRHAVIARRISYGTRFSSPCCGGAGRGL